MSNAHPSNSAASLKGRDFLSVTDVTPQQVRNLIDLAAHIKREPGAFRKSLDGKSVVVIFEKPSLRTRLSFDVGINRLGGRAVTLDHTQQRLGERETVADYGKNLERWCDAIVARVFKQTVAGIQEMADASRVPVINADSGSIPSLPVSCRHSHAQRARRAGRMRALRGFDACLHRRR